MLLYRLILVPSLLISRVISKYFSTLLADGGNYCACVNAATLALIDAGIPLRDYVTACTASLVDDKPLVDISNLESTQGGPELTVVSIKTTANKRYSVSFLNACPVIGSK